MSKDTTQLDEAYADCPPRPDALVLPEEVLKCCSLPREQAINEEFLERVSDLVEDLTVTHYGKDWRLKLSPQRVDAAALVVKYQAVLALDDSGDGRVATIQKMIDSAEQQSYSTYAKVRSFLAPYRNALITAGAGAAGGGGVALVLELLKGEFRHYREISPWLKEEHARGSQVRVLKGSDPRAAAVVNDLNQSGVPVRVWNHIPMHPKIRLYRTSNEYLMMLSTGNQQFITFYGSSDEGLQAAKDYFDISWSMAG